MKKIFLSTIILSLITSLAHAEVINNDTELTVNITTPERVDYLFSKLSLPVQNGNEITNKPHSYKLFRDETNALTVYCSSDVDAKQCVFSINKLIGKKNQMTIEENDNIRLSIRNPKDTWSLLEILDVSGMVHGDYAIKSLVGNDDEPFGLSCYFNSKNIDERACSLIIFYN